MAQGFDLLSGIAAAPTVEEAWALLVGRLRAAGFSRINYGFTRYRLDQSVGSLDDLVFLTTMGDDYVDFYLRSGFYRTTPIFRWMATNTGVCTWRWVDEDYAAGRLSATEAETVRINRKMGISAGITISFPDGLARTKGAMGILADEGLGHDDVDRIWAAEGPELLAACNMAHLRITSLPLKLGRRPLTDRQRQALEWVADGKTAQDIALLMGVSPAMVEKHLRLAREALDVETTAHAVAKAALLNQIFTGTAPGDAR